MCSQFTSKGINIYVAGRVKFYGLASGFRSWFVLQHYKRFAYKPFLTVIELSYPLQGELK
ncbi:TPA: DUF3289 family protein [Aeromonas veronii]